LVLRQVQTDLENEGFKIQCLVIPASGIGAWHQRKRVWIIANSCIIRRPHNARNHTQHDRKKETNENVKSFSESALSNDVSNTNKRNVQTGCERQWGVCKEHKEKGTSDNATSIYETLSNSNTRLSIRENKEIQTGRNTINSSSKDVSNSSIKGLQGCSIQHNLETEQRPKEFITKTSSERQQTWWQTQSRICGVPNGVSYELDKGRINRIKALGNSIVPQIARQIALAIKEVEKTEYEVT